MAKSVTSVSASVASQINSQITTALVNGDGLTGLNIEVNADDKDHVKYNHTTFGVEVVVGEDGTATVTTTETDGNGAKAATSSSTQAVDLSTAQSVENLNSITGMNIDIHASDGAHVMFNHVSLNVAIDADQVIDSSLSSSQDVSSTNEIVGLNLDVEASGHSHVKLNDVDANLQIDATQEIITNVDTTQSDNLWA